MTHRIAIIEDELPIQQMYKLKLEREGFQVATASDGRTGLILAETFRPHLILLDLRMPHMSGDEMLLHLRATDWGAAVQVIILTNISKDEAPQALRLLHVERYVVKAHHTPAQVVTVVKQTLGLTA